MARPKEKISLAFKQKSAAAADKLRTFQANKLQEDLERMLSDEVLPDLTVQLQGISLSLHASVVRARSRSLYDYLMKLSTSDEGETTVPLTKYDTPQDIATIFKSLYTEEDVTDSLKKLQDILTETSLHTGQPDTHIHNTFINGSDPLTVNGDETDIYEIADKIVQKSISDAKLIIQNNSVHNGIDGSEKTRNGLASSVDVIEKNNQTNGLSEAEISGSNILNNILTVEEVERVDEALVDSNSSHTMIEPMCSASTASDSLVRFQVVRDECSCSIKAMLEKVYGAGEVFEPCSRLGEDLLRLYLEELNWDQQFLVQGHTFRGHSCILSVRSSYFEAMLGGGWQESGSDQIALEGVSVSVMKQMLLYLYGGVVELDPACSIGNMMMMSDMYAMEGLKDVVAFNLNKEYCHFFHRPCSGCIVGVPDTLALTMIYNMDVLKEKCVKWINKNFDRVWPTKTFASLPQEVLEFCVSSSIKDLALDNVIDILIECRKLNETIPRLRWSEPVFDMIYQLMDAAIEYASQNFVSLVSSKSFKKLNQQGIAFNHQLLEDIFGMMILALSPENACQSYLSLNKWVTMVKPQEESQEFSLYSKEFWEFVEYLHKKCRDHLCMYIHQAANTAEWNMLTQTIQQELMEEANYVCIDEPKKSRAARPKLTSMQKKTSSTSISLREYFDCHFGSKENLPSSGKIAAKTSDTRIQKGRSPTPAKGNSSIASHSASMKSAGSSLMRKSGTTLKNTTKQPTDKSTLKTTSQSNKTQSRVSGNEPKSREPAKMQSSSNMKTDKRNVQSSKTASLSAKSFLTKSNKCTTKETLTVSTIDDNTAGSHVEGTFNDTEDLLDDDESVQPRARSSSAGAATFVPRFGQGAVLKSVQSMDSFFDSRQGKNFTVQKPLPTLTVNFIVPHEFFESF